VPSSGPLQEYANALSSPWTPRKRCVNVGAVQMHAAGKGEERFPSPRFHSSSSVSIRPMGSLVGCARLEPLSRWRRGLNVNVGPV
jgi:hypothetical protein